MGITTGIEWCDSTLNLQMGCDGCELWIPKLKIKKCYAGKLTQLRAGHKGYPPAFERPAIFPDRLAVAERWPDLRGTERPDKPWLNGLPRLIFLDDMGDTFTESLPLDWLAEFLPRMAAMPHIVILLTKRANRMLEFSRAHPFPPNFWLLVSVTSSANYARIPQLLSVRGGSVLGISYEPAWGPVDFTPWLPLRSFGRKSGWIIAGGESGAGAKPSHPDWFRAVRDQCMSAGVPFFFKQWGPSGIGRMLDGREWSQFPEVRAEVNLLLGFKLRFVPMVLDHSKRHTIRAQRKTRPRVGETCHCYTGLRTKKAWLLGRWPCIRVEDILIYERGDGTFGVVIDGVELSVDEKNALAWSDGFRYAGRSRAFAFMMYFWKREHGRAGEPLDFSGDLIHWNPEVAAPPPGRKLRAS